MMHSNKVLAVALGSLLTLAACSGSGPDGGLGDGHGGSGDLETAGSPAASASPAPAASTPASNPPSNDAGTDAKSDPPVVKHCNVTLAAPDTCIENAQGHAGDLVMVDIVLLGNPTCGDAGEADGRIAFDLTKLHLENEAEQVACRTRRVSPDVNGVDDVQWNAFGGGSLTGCQANLALGTVDTLALKIAAGTPPGDYAITWHDAAFIGDANAPQQCTTIGHGIAGTLRVLP